MLERSVDINNDWNFGNGIQSYNSGEVAVGQNIKARILSFLGNCFFDSLAGINWFVYFGTPGTQQQTLLSIQAVILQSYGVVKVNSMSLNLNENTGQAIITFNIQTIFSPSYSQSLVVNQVGS